MHTRELADQALRTGERVFSVYDVAPGQRVRLITEAFGDGQRNATTVLPIAEISRLVKAHGATACRYEELDDQAPSLTRNTFRLAGMPVQVIVPDLREFRMSPAGYSVGIRDQQTSARDQEPRRRWREVALLVKAKLMAAEADVVSLAAELLPNVVLLSYDTVGEWLPPRFVELQAPPPAFPLLSPAFIEEGVGA